MPRWHSPKRRRNSSSRSPQKDRYGSKKRFVSRSRSRSRKRSPQQYSRSPSPRYRPGNRPGYDQSGRKRSSSPISKRKQQHSSLNRNSSPIHRNRSFSPSSRRIDSPNRYKDPPSGKDKRSGDYYKSNVRGRSFTPEQQRKRSMTPKKRSGGKDFIKRNARRSRSRDGGNTKSYKRDRRNRSSSSSPQRSRSRKKEYYDDQKHESHGIRPDVSSSPSSSRKHHHDIDPSEIRININQSKPSPPRNKFNVEELVIPRRKDEGTKPLFDRPELRQRSYYDTQDFDEERRVVSVKKNNDNAGYVQGMSVQELASRERNTKHSLESITNLDQFHRNTATFQYSSLSKLDIDNISGSKLNQNPYQSQQNTYSQIDLQPRHTVENTHQTGRNDTPMFSLPTGDLRHCLKSRRSPKDQSSHSQKEKRSQDRNYKRSRSRSSQDVGSRNLKKVSPAKHSVSERLQKLASGNQSQDNLPNFRKELEEIQKDEWKMNPTIVPRSSQYFVHDDRGRRNSVDDKGPPIKPKSAQTGFSKFSKRGTSFRGFGRGSSYSSRGFISRRGFGRGVGRGTTYFGRGGKRSPTNWKHDMYDNKRGSRTSKSSENSKYLKHRKEQSNRPSSTAGRK
ncbi:serine/threonine-protein kinase PRP4 homolog [Anneissia japonica]|uniref:serine/threonine-protein kinase PRP4 homolog n=1 Tax=Anneissia japonica TaxID=1529436 RepID=UPI00142557E1|nr:serine/threonine-protein kinase PRP4 homolog [Anneissia japonica]